MEEEKEKEYTFQRYSHCQANHALGKPKIYSSASKYKLRYHQLVTVPNETKTVGIVARYDKKQALDLADELSEFLARRGFEVYLEDTLKDKVKTQGKLVPLSNMKTDFVITIGGDGTILRTCLSLPKPEPPILAVNMGVRGFLTEVEPKDACTAAENILNKKFLVEKCAKLSTTVDKERVPYALNDVVISGGEPSKIVYLQIYKNDLPVLKLEADGVIVSTRTGSTGYSLSAGGPVIDPQVDAIVVTPICSLTTVRSLVFPANCKIRIRSTRPKEILVLVDGNYRLTLPAKNPNLTIQQSKTSTSFIRFKEDFFSRFQSRLLFKGTG